jgi:hypothetical protein
LSQSSSSDRQYRFCRFKDPELVKKLQEARSGCVVMAMRREASVNALRDAPPAAVACWRGHTSINVLVTKVGIHIEELQRNRKINGFREEMLAGNV